MLDSKCSDNGWYGAVLVCVIDYKAGEHNTCSLVLTPHPPALLLQTNKYHNLDFVLPRYVPMRALTPVLWSEGVLAVGGRSGRSGGAVSPPRSLATAAWATETQRRTAVTAWRRTHSPAWL